MIARRMAAAATPLGQLPFFIEFLKLGGLFDPWVADCPLTLLSPNAPSKRDILGTLLLAVLAGHQRYAHITALRELKNHWGWGGLTTRDLPRCRLMARIVALISNGWSLFVRLADPNQHTEAITSRPLLLYGGGRQTRHANQTTITITSTHGKAGRVRRMLAKVAAFYTSLRPTAEQLSDLQRCYRILSRALVKYLKGRQLGPPPPALPA